MILEEDHPEVARRDCEDCKRWVYDKHGILLRRPDGTPEIRGVAPDCSICPKHAPDAEELSPTNFIIWRKFLTCRMLGCLPRPGGLDSQEPVIARKFEVLASLYHARQVVYRRASMLNLSYFGGMEV